VWLTLLSPRRLKVGANYSGRIDLLFFKLRYFLRVFGNGSGSFYPAAHTQPSTRAHVRGCEVTDGSGIKGLVEVFRSLFHWLIFVLARWQSWWQRRFTTSF
jgi:hypothetical protein